MPKKKKSFRQTTITCTPANIVSELGQAPELERASG